MVLASAPPALRAGGATEVVGEFARERLVEGESGGFGSGGVFGGCGGFRRTSYWCGEEGQRCSGRGEGSAHVLPLIFNVR